MEPFELSPELESLLAGYVLGDLTPEEAARVKQLVENNPEVAAEVKRLQSTLALLPLSLSKSVLPPQGLQSKILQAAQTDRFVQSPIGIGMGKQKWEIALASLTAMAIAALGIHTFQLDQKLASTQLEKHQLQQELKTAQASLSQLRQNDDMAKMRQELSRYQQVVNLLGESDNRFLNLRGMSPKSSSSGSLVIAPKSDTALLVLRDIDLLPEGKVYQMWAVMNGKKVPCIQFKPNNQGEVFLKIPIDKWRSATKVVVTVEPDRDIHEPVGEMVLTGS